MLPYEVRDACVQTTLEEANMTGILDLPYETMVAIFKHLEPVDDILTRLALVCLKWHDLLYCSGTLWKTINIDTTYYKSLHFRLVVGIFHFYGHHVQKLVWRENTTVYESIFSCLPRLKNLKVLRIPVLWTNRVIDDMCLLTGLENIQINGGFTLTDGHLFEIAKCLTNLKTVTLNACWRITINGVIAIVPNLQFLENVHLKVNSNLPLTDGRSETAIRNGLHIMKGLVFEPICNLVSVLCLHFVSMETEELLDVVKNLKNLFKLSISNCEHFHGIRLESDSLQKLCVFNIWSTTFISVHSPRLRQVTMDAGMESIERVEIFAENLRRAILNGSNSLRTLQIKSDKLIFLELCHSELIDKGCFRDVLRSNIKISRLRLGCISQDSLTLDENLIPCLQELCLLSDFSCEALHIRSPAIRLLHTKVEHDIITLHHLYIKANHLCKVALVGLPALKTVTVQCVSVDCIELNLCSDDQLHIESFVVHALNAIGFLRLFDCRVKMLVVSAQLAQTIVLYRCQMTDYVLQMALGGCSNISHLNLEKCTEICDVNISMRPLQYLNMYECTSLHRLSLDCPQLIAVNLGQCSNVKMYLRGVEQRLSGVAVPFRLVEPAKPIRWSHNFPPQEYRC
ncbi:hypothetical protein MAR_001815 [Mya arenaria]|uniref:F-box domain-containing protein n=1 Tax=Mya arenaria TaxID=6604 RepID=A0ABY7FG32_MYAAR|nr:uncharacterized protein LOC128209206 [Mya arenaria]WAR19977.1 hypothetical protein MAR_001815 [Mya arenaria]